MSSLAVKPETTRMKIATPDTVEESQGVGWENSWTSKRGAAV